MRIDWLNEWMYLFGCCCLRLHHHHDHHHHHLSENHQPVALSDLHLSYSQTPGPRTCCSPLILDSSSRILFSPYSPRCPPQCVSWTSWHCPEVQSQPFGHSWRGHKRGHTKFHHVIWPVTQAVARYQSRSVPPVGAAGELQGWDGKKKVRAGQYENYPTLMRMNGGIFFQLSSGRGMTPLLQENREEVEQWLSGFSWTYFFEWNGIVFFLLLFMHLWKGTQTPVRGPVPAHRSFGIGLQWDTMKKVLIQKVICQCCKTKGQRSVRLRY